MSAKIKAHSKNPARIYFFKRNFFSDEKNRAFLNVFLRVMNEVKTFADFFLFFFQKNSNNYRCARIKTFPIYPVFSCWVHIIKKAPIINRSGNSKSLKSIYLFL